MAAPKKFVEDNYQRAQDIVSLPRSVNYGRKSFRRDFSPEEREAILRRVSQVGIKRAADEYGASINVVKEWLKGFERAMEEPVEKTAKKQKQNRVAKDFSEKEKAQIVARAQETSLNQAARDFNTTRWVVKTLLMRASAKNGKPARELAKPTKAREVEEVKEVKAVKEAKTSKTSKRRVFTLEERAAIIKRADEIGLREAAEENNIAWQAIISWKYSKPVKKSKSPTEIKAPVAVEAPVKEATVTPIVPIVPTVATASKNLELENHVLKNKVEILLKEFNRLKKAVADLTELVE